INSDHEEEKQLIEDFDFEDFESIQIIYNDVENIVFLIDTLDLFSKEGLGSKDVIEYFFKEVFSTEDVRNKISLFDEKYNLFEKLIFDESFDSKDKLLLYSVINFHIKFKKNQLTLSENLIDFLRLVRNYVFSINQKGNNTLKDVYV